MLTQLNHLRYDIIYEPLDGEIHCGDQYLVKELDDSVLVAVADGLGHGEEAEFAAKRAIQILNDYSSLPIETLVEICDNELVGTRGTALTIVRVNKNYTLTYLAVGNVIGVCWKIDDAIHFNKYSFFLEGGIIGSRLVTLPNTKNIAMKSGDIFILATDGVKGEFEIEKPRFASPQVIAEQLFKKYRNPKDDGLILVVQLL
ncbi:MAG: hypothetical protein V4501_00955 [Pseudomonadota bacterium]